MGANNLFGIPYSNNKWVEGVTYDLSQIMPLGGTGFGIATNYACCGYRFGDRLIGRGRFNTGTRAAAVGWLNLPSGLNINVKYYNNTGLGQIVGNYYYIPVGTYNYDNPNGIGSVFYDGADTSKLFFAFRGISGVPGKDNANGMFLSDGEGPDFCFDIPIAQWAP